MRCFREEERKKWEGRDGGTSKRMERGGNDRRRGREEGRIEGIELQLINILVAFSYRQPNA